MSAILVVPVISVISVIRTIPKMCVNLLLSLTFDSTNQKEWNFSIVTYTRITGITGITEIGGIVGRTGITDDN